MWQPWVRADAASHLCLQYVHYFKLRQYWQFKRIQSRRYGSALVGFAPPEKAPRPPN